MEADLNMASKSRGCLLGSLLGDCLGEKYEFEQNVHTENLQQYIDKLSGPYFSAPVQNYTDDTAQTRCLARNLICNRKVETTDLAKRLTEEFFKDPDRCYGGHVIEVFRKLKFTNYDDPLGPAKEQFNGSGSFGNGAAMRVAPVPLMYYKNLDDVIENAKLSALVTHTNKIGIDGAILQAVAIHQCLVSNPKEKLDPNNFLDELRQTMSKVEKDEERLCSEESTPYVKQLHAVQELLADPNKPTISEVQDILGNEEIALRSVPTAIFCFLKALNNISHVKTENPFIRTVQYAISIGGDADTIASMAGAIAGAFYGDSLIPESLIKHCEGSKENIELADSLLELAGC